MKKIGIITYCTCSSLGSILQSMGLKRALKTLDLDGIVFVKSESMVLKYTKINSFKSLVKHFFERYIANKKKVAYKKRREFIVHNIDGYIYNNNESISEVSSKLAIDMHIAGSDQIWNMDLCDPTFFLDFLPEDAVRVSYAASMGKLDIPDHKRELLSRYIGRFDRISVREKQCAEVVRELTGKSCEVNIDPTFLVERTEWCSYKEKYNIKGRYILLYMIYWEDSCKEKIKKLKKKTGLPVIAISSGLSKVYADKYLYDVGVGEFLWLIDNADYVVTSSFHGVAFSIIFNKKFSAVINPKATSRIEHIMDCLCVPKVDITELDTSDEFDYDIVNKLIADERDKSFRYLEKVLNR